MELRRLLVLAFCTILQCENEYPSDPLQGQRSFTERNGRDYRVNEVQVSVYPRVKVLAGVLEGYTMKTIKGRSIAAFEGVPYAEDTSGKNRFKPAVPKRNWTGIRHAKKPLAKCLQIDLIHAFQLIGGEDCLGVNIYTPEVPTSKNKLPRLSVMVFFHGGSWYFGAGSEYGPAYLLEHDLILVTVNYRLGVLGFLSTGDDVLPGNLGMKDQSMALTWVQKNIQAFGGDPTRVTIVGQSSGAASVHFHMMSPLSRGKFAQGISLSGNAFSSWTMMNSKAIAYKNKRVARVTRCPVKPSEAFVACLEKLSPRRLTSLLGFLYNLPAIPTVPLGLVVERNTTGAFLTATPDDLYARNEVAKVPWISARNANETYAAFAALKFFGLGRSNVLTLPLWRNLAPFFLDLKFITENMDEIMTKSTDFYLKMKLPPTASAFSELATDRIFGYGIHKGLQLHSQLAPTYSWFYAYQGRNSLLGLTGEDPKKHGVTHTDDLPIYFNMSEFYPGYRTTDEEFAYVKLMTGLIASFVTTGKPSYIDERGTQVQLIEPITNPKKIRVLFIHNQVNMIPEPHQQRYKFWESMGLSDMKPFIPIE